MTNVNPTVPLLITPEELIEYAKQPNVVIADPRVAYINDRSQPNREGYLAGHVPGAVLFDMFEDFADPASPIAHTLPSKEQFERVASKYGISNDTHIIAVAEGWQTWATRVWWLFRYFGHDKVSVLDGGLTGWIEAGHPVETGEREPQGGGTFRATERPELLARIDEVEQIVAGDRDGQLVNALPYELFTGELPTHPGLAGRIPDSVNIPWPEVADLDTNLFKSVNVIRDATESTLLPEGENVIAYCGGGISATGLIFGLYLAGRGDVRLFDGSLEEWGRGTGRPLATGDPSAEK